jgi:hypothetical protein
VKRNSFGLSITRGEISGYNLNEFDLAELHQHPLVNPEYVAGIQSLKDQRYPTKDAFLTALRGAVGMNLSEQEKVVLAHAKRLSSRKVARLVRMRVQNIIPSSPLALSLTRTILLRSLPFSIWFRFRALRFFVSRKLSGRAVVEVAPNINAAGFQHNYKQMLDFLPGHRNRTERLMNVLRTSHDVDPRKARVLCVGPRNEAEVLLLRLYGFSKKNIEAIDLFSYSPTIKVMDMNELEFPDNHFDIYYSSAVIKYSNDIRRSVSEAVRVTRDGGFMAFGFTYGTPSELVPEGSNLFGGGRELIELFADHVESVYWTEEWKYAAGDTRTTLIFRLRK